MSLGIVPCLRVSEISTSTKYPIKAEALLVGHRTEMGMNGMHRHEGGLPLIDKMQSRASRGLIRI